MSFDIKKADTENTTECLGLTVESTWSAMMAVSENINNDTWRIVNRHQQEIICHLWNLLALSMTKEKTDQQQEFYNATKKQIDFLISKWMEIANDINEKAHLQANRNVN